MAQNFQELMNSSGKNAIGQLTEELEKLNSKEFATDDRFWFPAVDKAGNGYAVVRFLPPPPNEENRFVKLFTHGFKGPTGAWYIENCLTTLGKPDPVAEYNSKLWATEVEANRKLASKMKRKLGFISNVLVLKDPANPENEGKVKLMRYGKKIMDKITEAAMPTFPGEVAISPFDFKEGANFQIKIRRVEDFNNYDNCRFDAPSVLSEDMVYLEGVWKSEFSLQQFVSPSNFKSYDELKEKFYRVLGDDGLSLSGPTDTVKISSRPPVALENTVKREPIDELPNWDSPKTAGVATVDTDMDFFKRAAAE